MRYRWWVAFSVVLFAGGVVLGTSTPTGGEGTLSAELGALEDLVRFVTSLPPWAMFGFILLKNVTALLFSFAMSPLLLVVPVLSLVLNGWIIGLVATAVVSERSIGYLIAGLLPHGILELPAFFMGQAAALGFGTAAMIAVFRPDARGHLSPVLKTNVRYLAVALALLLPAALIEAFVTPLLLK